MRKREAEKTASRHDLDDAAYLRALAEALMYVPVVYGTDSADIDRLAQIARSLSK